ncbi:MAG: hypothetical protein GY862_29830, partial [Gammaproteobacteria bacterium]|nr:hypothetical protein [Gammaproteobacteria bacterium]
KKENKPKISRLTDAIANYTNKKTAKENAKRTKEEALAEKQAQLDKLQKVVQNEVSLPMHLLHTDPFGLSISGLVLSFARTKDDPLLFDSGNGKLALYFRGVNDQFFAAYFDTLTARAVYELSDGAFGKVLLAARNAGPEMDGATIAIRAAKDGADSARYCTAVLENSQQELKETWQNIPRDPQKLARILSGNASTKPGDPFYYDYKDVLVNKAGMRADRGSLLFTAVNKNAKEMLQDQTVSRNGGGETPACSWVADAQGNAFSFDGKDDYVALADTSGLSGFAAKGDITLEA